MKGKDVLDNVLHVLTGGALAGLIMWNYWFAGPVFLVVGFLREQAQHKKEGFFGWVNPHRLLEAASWGVGGLAASIVRCFVG